MKRRVIAYLIIVAFLMLVIAIPHIKWDGADPERVAIQLNGSVWNNETNVSRGTGNVSHPKICIAQWHRDVLTLEETLLCIHENMETTKR